MNIEFVKMHGLGNDFVVIKMTPEISKIDLSKFAKTISDRRIGIGCDQVIIYSESEVSSEYIMKIYNQDGSMAEACGNGTRCLVYLIGKESVRIKVLARTLEAKLFDDGMVEVNMGAVSFDKPWMPEESALWEIASIYKLEPKEMVCVDIGNPHLVIFNSGLSEEDKGLLGKMLEHNKLFPEGVNVNFAKIDGDIINLRVWERGDGFTLACGSGACATFAAAKKLGFAKNQASVQFKLGALDMSSLGEEILMKGPAKLVARGSYVFE
ncbi:MAG: diaminopimelate epimerase [Rickettsiaceae bacterium]|nr:diaminopimelate epimerase [Rickettsiaceae bacterium]